MEEVIKRYFQCWLDKDIDAVKEIFSDDIIYSECYGPVYKGIGQIIRWFEDWNRKGTVLQWDIKRVVVSGNTAVLLSTSIIMLREDIFTAICIK